MSYHTMCCMSFILLYELSYKLYCMSYNFELLCSRFVSHFKYICYKDNNAINYPVFLMIIHENANELYPSMVACL